MSSKINECLLCPWCGRPLVEDDIGGVHCFNFDCLGNKVIAPKQVWQDLINRFGTTNLKPDFKLAKVAKRKPKTGIFRCVVCGESFEARIADRKRGWAKCCSKSCAAKKSNADTGKYERYLRSLDHEYDEDLHPHSSEALGQWCD